VTVWDPRLISRAEAAELAGAERVVWEQVPESGALILRHLRCGKSCGMWGRGVPTSPDDITAGVLRHLVTFHDLPLNRAERERRASDGQ
jgi:hypothetical protein